MSKPDFKFIRNQLLEAAGLIRKTVLTLEHYHCRRSIYSDASSTAQSVVSRQTLQELNNGIQAIRKAYVYLQRIESLLMGIDSEEVFALRLEAALRREALGCADCDLKI